MELDTTVLQCIQSKHQNYQLFYHQLNEPDQNHTVLRRKINLLIY